MNTPARATSADAAAQLELPFPLWLRRTVWILALALVVVFVAHAANRFLVVTEASYGRLWPNRHWLLPHFIAGSVALLAGIAQFCARLRRSHPALHRWVGRTYLLGVAVGAASAYALSFRAVLGWPFGVAGFVMACAWVGATAMAYVAIRCRQFRAHSEWMLRSYVVAFGFVTFRLMAVSPLFAGLGPVPERLTVLLWLSWTLPLLAVEWLLQRPRVAPRPSLAPAH